MLPTTARPCTSKAATGSSPWMRTAITNTPPMSARRTMCATSFNIRWRITPAGPPTSSGGDFAALVPPLDPGAPLGDLLPPTELVFTPPEFQPVNPGIVDHTPTVIIETPDNPAGAVDASESVNEKGLASRGS